jgi:hypothetical protein
VTVIGLPKLDLDISSTISEFLALLRSMDAKLDTLIEIERAKESQR